MAAEAAIATEALTKKYGEFTAVNWLDLEVRPGEIFGLLGPNGAGKTTTILMLLGLSEPTSGSARVLGLDPVRQPLDVKRVVGYLPDNVGFYGDLTGRENLRYTARLNGLSGEGAETRVSELLQRVGLASASDKRAGTYSRGMRQRLGIADALLKRPRVLILDEPTIGLDPEGAQECLDLVRQLANQDGVTVLLSSHLLHQVQAICDRVAIFVEGRIVAQGRVDELAAAIAGERVLVEVESTDAERGERVLRSLDGVREVERHGPRLVAICRGDQREAIAQAFLAEGLPLTHLRRRGADLDEIYRRYFEGHDHGEQR